MAVLRHFDRAHRRHTFVLLMLVMAAFLGGFDLALVALLHDWLPPDATTFAEKVHGPLTAWVGFLGTAAALIDAIRKPPDEAA